MQMCDELWEQQRTYSLVDWAAEGVAGIAILSKHGEVAEHTLDKGEASSVVAAGDLLGAAAGADGLGWRGVGLSNGASEGADGEGDGGKNVCCLHFDRLKLVLV